MGSENFIFIKTPFAGGGVKNHVPCIIRESSLALSVNQPQITGQGDKSVYLILALPNSGKRRLNVWSSDPKPKPAKAY